MIRVLKWACAPLLAIILGLAGDASRAEAGGFGIYIGGGFPNYGYGSSIRHGSAYGRSYRPPFSSRYGNFGRNSFGRSGFGASGFGPGVYRSARPSYDNHHPRVPHYHYHGPTLVPHRNHWDLIPGHYDFHSPRHRRH